MKKLTKIRLINWHYISNETIEVKDNVLLTGPNASGKSTIMDAITFVITAGDTQFNLAANDKGKRDLKGYVKCKLGIDDKEYLREGDVSGHVALEFYDETLETSFFVGAVIDAFGDLAPVKVLFYQGDGQLQDYYFVSPDGIIYSTVEFRKHNTKFEYFLTKKEAKRGFRTAFGSVNEDFFKLIPKSLAFKPISDVKDFIYQNILEEKEIDVSSIKDSIRSYKELEATLNTIKAKIGDLHIIGDIYNQLLSIENDRNYLKYLMRLFDQEKLLNDIKKANKEIEKLEESKQTKETSIRDIEKEIDGLNDRSKDLYIALNNNEEFKAEEYINREISKVEQEINSLEDSQTRFLRKASQMKDSVNKLRKISNNKIYTELANMSLVQINQSEIETTKIKLRDIKERFEDLKTNNNQNLGRLESEKQELVSEIEEIRQTLANLDQNKKNYNPKLLMLRNDIALGLKRIYNYDVSVHIFAELIEIDDPVWADTVEIFLGNRRFDFIVEPRYFDQALSIFARIKSNYDLYGVGLVNTKQMAESHKFENFKENSLASIISSENVDARRYVNMTCGTTIMVSNENELDKFDNSITNDGLIYRSFTVRSMNPNIPKPFIGKNALSSQAEIWNKKAKEKKEEYISLMNEIDGLKEEINIINTFSISEIVEDLDSALKLSKLKNTVIDLKAQKERQNNMTVSDLHDDYNKILETIKNYEVSKNQILQEIGGIANAINSYTENIASINLEIEQSKKVLSEISNDSIELTEKAYKEYERVKSLGNFDKAFAEYERRIEESNNEYNLANDNLATKQFQYINAYNSTYSVGVSEMPKFIAELAKLEKSELVKYEQKVRMAREEAELIFREDFLSKLRNNIMTAEAEIEKINETLSNITFGRDRYQFIFPRSNEYSEYYDMVTSKLDTMESGMMTYDFQNKYSKPIEELFDALAVDELNSNGVISKFTDYRTYMDYDIKITNEFGESMTYSKVFKEKSGGETQVPFYVAIIASFVRVYTKTHVSSGDTIGIVMFDEVFDKMDANRMRAMMNFISSMPLQVIIACPPQRMSILSDYAATTLIMVRQGSKAQVLPVIKNKINGDVNVE